MNEAMSIYINQTHQFGMLSLEEETILAKKIKEGCEKSRNKMITCHLRIVYNIATYFSNKRSVYFEDLIQEGNLGLVYAVDSFDISKKMRFAIYAKMWVKEFIKRHFYKSIYILSTPFRVVQKSFAIRNDDEASLDEEKKTGENIAIQNIAKNTCYIDDESLLDQNKSVCAAEFLGQEEQYEHSNFLSYVKCLAEKYLTVLEYRVITERFLSSYKVETYQKISEKTGVSIETVRNLEKKALKKLKKIL